MKPALWHIFFLVFFTYGYFFQSGSWNENARLDQVRAWVEYRQVSIDRFSGNTGDIVRYQNKIYPAKAPGSTYLAIPAYWVFSQIFELFDLPKEIEIHFICYFTIWWTLGLFSAALCVFLFVVLEKVSGNATHALLLCLAYAFGTLAFPFSTMYFGHQLAAAFLFFSFGLIFLMKGAEKISPMRIFLSGLCAGFSLTTEYPALLAVVPLCGYFVWTLWRHKVLSQKIIFFFALGLGLGGFFLVAYNLLAFGKFYFIPHQILAESQNSSFPDHRLGFLGVQWPNFGVLTKITFGIQRGIFVCNPWLLLMVPALLGPIVSRKFRTLFFSSPLRAEMILCALIWLIFLAFNSGYGSSVTYWGGGSSVGPRHIIPALPFAVFLISPLLQIRSWRLLFYSLALLSVAIMLVATAVEPRPVVHLTNPFTDLYWNSYLRSDFAIFPQGIFNNQFVTINSVAFNLGKLLRLKPAFQLLPLWILWLWLIPKLMDKMSIPAKTVKSSTIILVSFLFFLFVIPFVYQFSRGHFNRISPYSGLRGIYRKGVAWTFSDPTKPASPGQMYWVRVDPQIYFPYGHEDFSFSPPFSAEWQGSLFIARTGEHKFSLFATEGAFVYIDNELVVQYEAGSDQNKFTGTLELEEGMHDILIRFFTEKEKGELILQWAPPGEILHPIPSQFLFWRA